MKKNVCILLSILLLIVSGCRVSTDNSVTLTGAEYDEYLEDKKKIEKIEYLEQAISKDFLYDIDEKNMEDGLYKGIFASLEDPYSVYYTESEFEKLMEDNKGEFGGIGIVITAQSSEFITVVSPIADTPGEKAGILSGDKIIAINDKVYFGDQLEEAVDTMRGEPGTEVKLTIRRLKEDEEKFEDIEMNIVREVIKVDSVRYEPLADYTYIQISSFDEHTASDFNEAINIAKDKSLGAIIDLRNNPGGLLSSVVEISDMLLPKGEIVSTIDKNGNRQAQTSDKSMIDLPIVVLINGGSASASEILAGALQDYSRAKIVGEKSFGKGVVQKIYPLDEGGYKLTVSEYYTAKGKKIHDKGVIPDVEVGLPEDAEGIGPDYLDDDRQLAKALEIIGR